MLIKFRAENHRSLRGEQALSLAATEPRGDRDIDASGTRVVPATAIYGANASGKTNVLLAFEWLVNAVLWSARLWDPEAMPRDTFAFGGTKKPAMYEADFASQGVRYRYGFVQSSTKIAEEWLYAWPKNKKQVWLERDGSKFKFGREFHGENEAIRELTRENALFLSTAVQSAHKQLMPIYQWFRQATFHGGKARSGGVRGPQYFSRYAFPLSLSTRDLRPALAWLKLADTGIIDVRVDKKRAPMERGFSAIFLRHQADDESEGWLPLAEESAGTAALVELAAALDASLHRGGIICIDELGGKLHPSLALAIIERFHNAKSNLGRGQIIFTTHDTNLLGRASGPTPLRRDQIWFTEKDKSGATTLYPLTDFRPRKSENLERGYLQGRYGAVPFLGGLPDYEGDQDELASQR